MHEAASDMLGRIGEPRVARCDQLEPRGHSASQGVALPAYRLRLLRLRLFPVVIGEGVVWYSGQFWALYFLQQVTKLDALTTAYIVGAGLIIGTPTLIFFGWLSDHIRSQGYGSLYSVETRNENGDRLLFAVFGGRYNSCRNTRGDVRSVDLETRIIPECRRCQNCNQHSRASNEGK